MGLSLPRMNPIHASTDGVTAFAGYDHNLVLADNAFYDMRNMTSALLPVMSVRKRRRKLRQLTKPNGLFAHDKLCWVDGTDFYYNGEIKGQVADGEKQFARMGAYVLIWPDRVYYNTYTGEFGALGAKVTTAESVSCALCRMDGTPYAAYATGTIAPETPANGDYWLDTGVTPNVLRQYAETESMWVSIPTVYTKIASAGIGTPFAEHDGVSLSGFVNDALNGDFYIVGCAADYVVIVALIAAPLQQDEPVTVERKVPLLDCLTECDNRLWGCSSANHEIYACALGDPKNWNQYLGLATDSYAVTVGSTGDFTGACTHLGNVLFFKENMIHQIMGTKPANFTLDSTACRGVSKDSGKSVCIVNETLFYKSVRDVCAFSNALPAGISAPLGTGLYHNAVAGALGGRYYLCMRDEANACALFVYDTTSGVWCREDGADVRWFASLGDELYFLDGAGWLWSVGGGCAAYESQGAAQEEPLEWMMETGDIGLNQPYSKFISRIQLYAECELGASVRVEIQYDHLPQWTEVYRAAPVPQQSLVVPLLPRRCRTLRLRLRGVGDFRLYSIVKKTETGSDSYAAT